MGIPTPADLREAQVQRDREIALRYVRKGAANGAVKEISAETGIDIWTIYRAIRRQRSWAEEHLKDESPGTDIPRAQ